jgi:type II secretory pathway pseudopilin PulG
MRFTVETREPDLKRCQKERGFSLIELLIASFVLLTGVVAVAVMIGTSINRDLAAKNDTIAMSAAEQQMEILKTTDFVLFTPGGSTLQADGRLLFENPTTGSPYSAVQGYSTTVSLANSDQTGNTATYDVRWNVAYADAANSLLRITVGARRTPGNLRLPPTQLVYIKAR